MYQNISANPKYATVTELNYDVGTSTASIVGSDLAKDLTSLTELSSSLTTVGKLVFTCDDVVNSNKRFVVSEDCATTHSGVTIKSIYDLKDVATELAALTLDDTA